MNLPANQRLLSSSRRVVNSATLGLLQEAQVLKFENYQMTSLPTKAKTAAGGYRHRDHLRCTTNHISIKIQVLGKLSNDSKDISTAKIGGQLLQPSSATSPEHPLNRKETQSRAEHCRAPHSYISSPPLSPQIQLPAQSLYRKPDILRAAVSAVSAVSFFSAPFRGPFFQMNKTHGYPRRRSNVET